MTWFGHLVRMPLGCLPVEVFRACPSGRQTQDTLERLYLSAGLGMLWYTPTRISGRRRGWGWGGVTADSGFGLCVLAVNVSSDDPQHGRVVPGLSMEILPDFRTLLLLLKSQEIANARATKVLVMISDET